MDQQSENLPLIPFSPAECVALRKVLQAYELSLRRGVVTPERARYLVHVRRITRRLTAQLAAQQEVCLALDGAEIDALLKALRDFGCQIEELFPHTQQRDLAVATLTGWQQRVIDLLLGCH